MEELIYKLPQRAGITDLCNVPPDRESEWWTSEQWEEWHNKKEERAERDREYIQGLKNSGHFGNHYDITVRIGHNAAFDYVPDGIPLFSHFKLHFPDNHEE